MEKFKSLEKYDCELKKGEVYKIHKELLPFIGKYYENTGILLVGESHRIGLYDKNDNGNDKYNSKEKDYYNEEWYDKCLPSYDKWVDTRFTIEEFLNDPKRKDYSRMFSNPAKELVDALKEKKKINITEIEAFQCFAFFNYFQKPAPETKSFEPNNIDSEIAHKNFDFVVDILKPKSIIFLSKKAYDAYIKYGKNGKMIKYVDHPNRPCWYRAGGKFGRKKFKNYIEEVLDNIADCVHPINE